MSTTTRALTMATAAAAFMGMGGVASASTVAPSDTLNIAPTGVHAADATDGNCGGYDPTPIRPLIINGRNGTGYYVMGTTHQSCNPQIYFLKACLEIQHQNPNGTWAADADSWRCEGTNLPYYLDAASYHLCTGGIGLGGAKFWWYRTAVEAWVLNPGVYPPLGWVVIPSTKDASAVSYSPSWGTFC